MVTITFTLYVYYLVLHSFNYYDCIKRIIIIIIIILLLAQYRLHCILRRQVIFYFGFLDIYTWRSRIEKSLILLVF